MTGAPAALKPFVEALALDASGAILLDRRRVGFAAGSDRDRLAEALIMVCARVMGNHVTVTMAGNRGNFELNVMMPVMAEALLESIRLMANAVRTFTTRCVVGIQANKKRAQQLLELNPSIATALNPYIGYDKAAVVAKQSAKEGRSVRDVVQEMGLLKPADLNRALDVRAMTEPGVGKGGGGGG